MMEAMTYDGCPQLELHPSIMEHPDRAGKFPTIFV